MIVALAGGVGGAKLAHGLAACLPPGELSVVVNTADDFDWHGLRVCPDLDTVMYTLAGIANPDTGWGVAGDTWTSLDMLRRYGQDPWFRIGDKDLATHVLRTRMLREGSSLTETAGYLAGSLGVRSVLLPMCDEPVATLVETDEGALEFQEYFVHRRHSPTVTGVKFRGIEEARITEPVLAALNAAELVVFCPSNPIVSIGPILAVPGLRDALKSLSIPKVAVSPIVGGQALRGPAGDMLASLGHEVSAHGVAEIYADVLQGVVIDSVDAALASGIQDLGIRTLVTGAIMRDEADRRELAAVTLEFGLSLSRVTAGRPG